MSGKAEDDGEKSNRSQRKFVTFSEWVRNTSFEESIFLTFGCSYRTLLFKYTFREMRLATSCFFKKEQMKVLQNYESLVNILSMAFGGNKKEPNIVHDIKSVDQLQKALGGALNGR